jgi:hypothetical protein
MPLLPPSSVRATSTQREAVVDGGGSAAVLWLFESEGRQLLAAVNFEATAVSLSLPPELPTRGTLLRSTEAARTVGGVRLDRFILLPREAVLLRMGAA